MQQVLTLRRWRHALTQLQLQLLEDLGEYVSLRCSKGHTFTISKGQLTKSARMGTPGCDACGWDKLYNQTRAKAHTIFKKLNLTLLEGDPRGKAQAIKLRCPEGHVFETLLGYILRAGKLSGASGGCKACRDEKHSFQARDRFYQALEELGYERLEDYENARKKIKVRRRSDGALNAISTLDLTSGRTWPEAPSKLLTEADMQKYLDEFKPGFKLVDVSDFKGVRDPSSRVTVACPDGHQYKVQWTTVKAYGCDSCGQRHVSKRETSLGDAIRALGVQVIPSYREIFNQQQSRSNRMEIDLYLPDHKLGIEHCGLFYHSDHYLERKNHLIDKRTRVRNEGVELLTVFEDEWKHRAELVMSHITRVVRPAWRAVVSFGVIPWYLGLGQAHQHAFLPPNPKWTLLRSNPDGVELLMDFSGPEPQVLELYCTQDWVPDSSWTEALTQGLKTRNWAYQQDLRLIPDSWVETWELTRGKILPPSIFWVRGNKRLPLPDLSAQAQAQKICQELGEAFLTLEDCGYAVWRP